MTANFLPIRIDPFLGLELVVCKGNPVTISSGLNSATFSFKDTTEWDSNLGYTGDTKQQTIRSLRSVKGFYGGW